MTNLMTPVGRMVAGHPMERNAVLDDRTNQPKLGGDGQPMFSTYIGIAIPKGAETDWKETEWGRVIYAEGVAGWPNGEYRSPTFAWKITDGDSRVPNKKGKIPAEREGWAGHWILHVSTMLPGPRCFHAGAYEPHQIIQRKEEIKRGDYIRLYLSVKGNAPSVSPGVYLNPELFELTRAGIQIASEGANAAEAFGGAAPVMPANAQLADQQPNTVMGMPEQFTAPPPAVQPHTEFVTNAGQPAPPPPVVAPPATQHVMLPAAQGATYEQMIAAGWTDALLIQHGMMQG